MIIMIRDMCCSPRKLLVAMFLIMSFCRTCKALNEHRNCSSLCGDQNIRSPFRLKDSPEQCGDHRYNLSCEHNQLVMYWQSGRYSVLSINYEHYTIRVRDANIMELDSSSLPLYSLTHYNFSRRDPYASTFHAQYENGTCLCYLLNANTVMRFVRCEHPVYSPWFLDTASCFKTSNGSLSSSSSSSYWYVNAGNGYYVGDLVLEKDCRIEMMYITSWPSQRNKTSWSCTDIRNMLLHGFDLSWLNSFCPDSGDDYEIILVGKQPGCQRAVRSRIFRRILPNILDLSFISKLVVFVGLLFIQVNPNDHP